MTSKPTLRWRGRLHSADPCTPPSAPSLTKPKQSPGYLDRIDTVVQRAVAVAMERERRKLSDDMEKRENNLRELLDEKLASLHDLEVSIDSKLQQLRDIEKSVSDNTTNVNALSNRLDHIEQYSRRNNIRILGVKSTPDEDTDEIVRNVAQQIGVTLTAYDIDRSHRLRRPNNNPHDVQGSYAGAARNANSSPPPIIVKFTSYKPKLQMMKNRRKLKGSGTVIVEDLTKKNSNLLFQTSKKTNVKASWTIDGRVFALVKSTGGQEKKKLITGLPDLNSI